MKETWVPMVVDFSFFYRAGWVCHKCRRRRISMLGNLRVESMKLREFGGKIAAIGDVLQALVFS